MKEVKIRIIGVGGAGNNAVEQLKGDVEETVLFTAVNTDVQALANLEVEEEEKLALGHGVTRGLSVGGDAGLARKIAEAEKGKIGALVQGVDLIFLIVGLGGGTGSGMASYIAELARKQGATVIAFATLPFTIEGGKRHQVARDRLGELRTASNAVIPLPNDLLLQQLSAEATVLDAFRYANGWISRGVNSMLKMLYRPGIINLDFASLRSVFSGGSGGRGGTLFGLGSAEGEGYIQKALNELTLCPLLHIPQAPQAADSLLVNIVGGGDLSLKHVNDIGAFLSQHFSSKENTVVGAVIDEGLEESVEICVIGVADAGMRAGGARKGRQRENPKQQVLFDDVGGGALKGIKEKLVGGKERGYFYETEENPVNGEDPDIPSYLRRGIKVRL